MWIEINDPRKPHEREQVIVWHKNWGAETAHYVNGNFTDMSGKDNHTICDLNDVITAWRSLPTRIPKQFRERS